MFSRIAGRYDLMNTVMTAGQHHRWRRHAAGMAVEGVRDGPVVACDVATGTGDLALALARRREVTRVVAVDFLPRMLSLASAKVERSRLGHKVNLVLGDALHLPFPDNAFHCTTAGFSMRNVSDVGQALAEMARVTRPGRCVLVLEAMPVRRASLFGRAYHFYFRHLVPLLGALLAGNREDYSYLPESVYAFADAQEFASRMEQTGLRDVRYRLVGLGTAAIHVGTKPL
jgi:demethylmenaquinone methyltransferase/2-methoxy-6-polyprenyl-1,4-benzoquinol methylase